jgi:hypothetical protein
MIDVDPLVPDAESAVERARQHVAALECAVAIQGCTIEARRWSGESSAASASSLPQLQVALICAYIRLANELRKVEPQ